MPCQLAPHQKDLFETDDPPFLLSLDQRKQLLPLVTAMLIEITTDPLMTEEEVGDDEDHV